jgi:hypothetical protein
MTDNTPGVDVDRIMRLIHQWEFSLRNESVQIAAFTYSQLMDGVKALVESRDAAVLHAAQLTIARDSAIAGLNLYYEIAERAEAERDALKARLNSK